MIDLADRRRDAPPINGRFAPAEKPKRCQRSRRRGARTPPGVVYVGRPTLWGNPFSGRPKIGHARSVILYRAWLAGQLSFGILERAGLSAAEIDGLVCRRPLILQHLPDLAGRDLQCWCPLTSDWCHAEVLLSLANNVSVTRIGGVE